MLWGAIITLLNIASVIHSQNTTVPLDGEITKNSIEIPAIPAVPDISFGDTPAVWAQSFSINCNTPKECNRDAKRFLKRGFYISAIGYSAKTFTIGGKLKKRDHRRAMEILTASNYDLAIKEYEQYMLEFPEVEYVNWSDAKTTYYRMWRKAQFNMVNTLLQDHPELTFDTQEPDTHSLGILATKLSSYREYAAEDYYKAGLYWKSIGQKNKDKSAYKRAAYAFRISNQYVSNYKDVIAQFEKMKKLATVTVYLSGKYYSSGQFGTLIDNDVRAELLLIPQFKRLEFIEIVSTKKADYHIKLVTNGLELVTRGKTNHKRDFTKEVKNKDGKVVTKNASIITYTSGYTARAKINAEVIEKRTNNIVYATTSEASYDWITTWQKGSGDTDIVKSKYKRYLGKSPDRAPNRKTLYDRAIALNAKDLAYKLYIGFFIGLASHQTH